MILLYMLSILKLSTGLQVAVIYNKYTSDRDSGDFILKSGTMSTVEQCIVFCKEIEVMSVGYNAGDGKCTCHLALPETLSLTPSPGINIYGKFIPQGCRAAVTLGYLYEHGANLCYKVHHTRRQWVEAKVECENEGAILIKADPAPVMQIVKKIITDNNHGDFYLGATDEVEDGVWRWIRDNSTVQGYTDTGSKDCLEMGVSLILEDSDCSWASQKFICEIPLD